MKVVLSRKGFDAGYGGYSSIVLEDKTIISFPIPQKCDKTKYSEIKTPTGDTMYEIMKSLSETIKDGKKEKLTKNTRCHLDPDLYYGAIKRDKKWRGCFGQVNAAETHLENNGVKEGDLFIFFGWYRNVVKTNSGYEFVKGSDRHMMFGYLQIDKIIHLKDGNLPKEYQKHPHAYYDNSGNNTIYIAKEVCSFDKNIKGYGMFKYDKELDLTKEGMSKRNWKLPSFFKKVNISYHDKASWKNGYFQSVCKGQEFVIEDNKQVEKWAINLIKKHSANRV